MKKKIGRPKGTIKNVRLHEILKAYGCSRPTAYKLLRKEERSKR